MAFDFNIISSLAKPFTDMYNSRQERKTASESAKAKLRMKKEDHSFDLQMTDKEWEALGKSTEASSLKDEYVTVIITMPIPMILLGALWSAYTGDTRVLEGVNKGISELAVLGLDMGFLMEVVVLAAVGIKAFKR